MESLKNMSSMQVSTGLLLLSQLVASVMVSLKHKELLDDGSSTDVGANADLLQKLMMFMAVSWVLFGLTVMCLVWNVKNPNCKYSKNCLPSLAVLTVVAFMYYGWDLRDELSELSNVFLGAGVLSLAPLGVKLMEMQKGSSQVVPKSRSPASFAMCGSGY
jgi:uncharacterized membrane protein YqjE